MTARYRAPAQDGGLLIEPPPERVGELVAANTSRLNTSSVRIAGIPLAEFRRRAVAEVVDSARQYLSLASGGRKPPDDLPGQPLGPASGGLRPPLANAQRLFVAGHQPEFFHPGVWVKNFVLNAFAKRHGAVPLNLVVDNDSLHPPVVRVPAPAESPAHVHAVPVEYDRPVHDLPYEEYRVADRGVFDSFPRRLADKVRNWNFEPMAFSVWPKLQAELDRGVNLAEAVSRVRRDVEREWGVANLELPVSKLAETRAFAQFLHTILSDLPRFVACYNAAIRAYRAANHVRSLNHPAPELAAQEDKVEAPFWTWQSGSARRERLFVRGDSLLAGDTPIGRLPAGPEEFADDWHGRLADGWKVRPRALTLTLFVRLGVADLFIHGIGGAKYDEVTDEIMRRFFGIEPPGYSVVSATLRLPLPRFPASEADLHTAERRVRDLLWNPQNFPATVAKFPRLVEAKARLIAEEPERHAERRIWFRKLQDITQEMRLAVAEELAAAEQSLQGVHTGLAANSILANREYAWLLFPEPVLRTFFIGDKSRTIE